MSPRQNSSISAPPPFDGIAGKLLGSDPVGALGPGELAARAAGACERLTGRLARLIGSEGANSLLRRSILQASTEFSWLLGAVSADIGADSITRFREAMASHDVHAATRAFTHVLTLLVAVLTRLIGAALVGQLMHEVWPDVFPLVTQETS